MLEAGQTQIKAETTRTRNSGFQFPLKKKKVFLHIPQQKV